MDQSKPRTESKPLLCEKESAPHVNVNLPEEEQKFIRHGINLDELRDRLTTENSALGVDAGQMRQHSDSFLLHAEMQPNQTDPHHRYQKNNTRKLSQSRGIKLPSIKLDEVSRPRSINLDEIKREYSPPIATSPIGYTLRHDELLVQDLNRSTHSESFNIGQNSDENVVDIRIFFANGKAVQLAVENGAEAMAADLLPLIAEHLEIDEEVANETLALWLISPLFEIQLKPYHVAYQVHNKWPMFLRRFTTAEEEQIAFDEPILVVRRNVNLTIPVEVMYQDEYERLTEILYFDAKDEYLSGRYVVDVITCTKVAALQLAIEYGPQENDEEAADIVHEKIAELVPAYLLNRIKSFYLFGQIECKSGYEKHIVNEYKTISQLYADNHSRRKAYLDILRQFPFYGATFFSATTDKRQSSSSVIELSKRLFAGTQQSQLEITVGVSSEYITLVERQKNELLLTRCIFDCSWFKSSETNDDNEGLPSFFLHFPDDKVLSELSAQSGENSPPSCGNDNPEAPQHQPPSSASSTGSSSPVLVSRLLQLFSKQASMMEGLMNSLYERNLADFGSMEELGSPASSNGGVANDEINSPLSNGTSSHSAKSATSKSSNRSNVRSDVPSPCSSLQYPSKLTKLCLATLDPEGKCVAAKGSLRLLLECN